MSVHMNPQPLVSCIVPTRPERRRFWPMMFRCFQQQQWESKELLLVDEAPLTIELPPSVKHKEAITLTRRAVDALSYCPRAANWPHRHQSDIMLAWTLMDTLYAEHYPSLVQHTAGSNSTCGHEGSRTSSSFVGEDFDALSLLELTSSPLT